MYLFLCTGVQRQSNMVQQVIFCSQTSCGYKNINLCRAEKSMLLHAVRLQCPSQTYCCLLTFLYPEKMSCWQCCCSCLQHGGLEAKALVAWGLLCSLWLANCQVPNNFLNTIKHGGVWTKCHIHSSLSWCYPTTCSPSLDTNLADC